jgi:hypothetical protein
MTPKSFVSSTIVGGVTVLVTGSLIFALPPLQRFYAYAMTAGSASGVARESPQVWAVVLGALSYGAFIALAIGSRQRAITIADGFRIGALVGFLLWFTANFMLFGVSHVGNMTSAIVNPLIELVPGAISGAVIAAALRRGHIATPSSDVTARNDVAILGAPRCYSSRSVDAGSSRAARRAGIPAATAAVPSITSAATASVAGSRLLS